MIRRTLLRLLVAVAIGLAAGIAPADPVDDIIAEIREQGFEITRVQRTWLGRVRIIAQNPSYRREVVIDPTTGEIRRDLLIPKPGGSPAQPPASQRPLGSSRGVGQIGEEPATGTAPDEGDDAGWGGGWGSQEPPADGAGEGDADDAQ
jgi:hypothetical protein